MGRSLARRPVAYAVSSGLVLAVLAIFALGFNPNFDLGDSGAPKDVESSVALRTLQKGLPAGATDPTQVFLTSARRLADQQDRAGHLRPGAARPTGWPRCPPRAEHEG